ncbi:transporter suffix domain-containing protein [Francisella philomiragia]|uniref:Membrane protein n=1 Tax=Francisella philomiragia TaxID=28110 RepID=A0AAW3DAU7_9GAMM|nr:transporter suffix domain-containing protein [Francisella philomiragia]KFJ42610.1 putative membrane protein [Francisella philomiragia]MBK2253846.1 transporter suffix domain-containing protein [Francisella philomiragia]MBK2272158.1 transporter suffix domain-containing protein [Francisella philomiragia]MBK2276000.1 transporter suffix domain-containing protein [Francisella philomiragia]MBK2279947.1 transporter suffix domain-containing protein [Francisella philomiragia]
MTKDWKYYLGLLLFILSFVPYIVVFCIMPFLGLSTSSYLAISSILLVSAEGIFLISVMLLGKVIIDTIKSAIKTIFKSAFTTQKPISRKRHSIGLVMFFASLVYPTLLLEMILIFDKISQVGQLNMMFVLFSGDIIFVASFFVLGGDFINKLKSVFRYSN